MKTQIQKPSAGRTKYSKEYKQEALAHWKECGRSAARVAAELGIRAPLLYRWNKQLRVEELQARIRHLTEENAKLLEQREVLKKSLGILSEPPPRSMPKSSK
jgi:transposase